MLGSGMLVLGIPVAIGSSLHAYREGTDRGFVRVAIVACVLAILTAAAEILVPGGLLRRFLP